MSKPSYLKIGEHGPELLGREPVLLADVPLLDEEKRLVVGDREAGASRRRPPPARAIVSGVRCPFGVPVGAARAAAFSALVDQIAALGLQLLQERVVDRRVDEQVAVGGAAGSVIVGLADARVARRLDDVRRLVDHHRRVAGADAVGRLAGAVRGLHHRRAAGRDRQVAGAISSFASGMLGRSTHCSRSSGAPSLRSAARMTRTVSFVVFRLPGCGEKITASLHLIA